MIPLLALVFCPVQAPPACEGRCYLLLFGGQAERYRARTAHTWATFAKGSPAGLEQFTISWLPVCLPVRPLQWRPEAGRNYGLHETLDLFNTGKQEIGLWGPYEIPPCWYARAAAHKTLLDSGTVTFNTLDRGPLRPRAPVRHPEISHCVHAITRTNEGLRLETQPVLGTGQFITRKLAEAMAECDLLIKPGLTHEWLLPALGVDGAPVIRRSIGDPLLKVLR